MLVKVNANVDTEKNSIEVGVNTPEFNVNYAVSGMLLPSVKLINKPNSLLVGLAGKLLYKAISKVKLEVKQDVSNLEIAISSNYCGEKMSGTMRIERSVYSNTISIVGAIKNILKQSISIAETLAGLYEEATVISANSSASMAMSSEDGEATIFSMKYGNLQIKNAKVTITNLEFKTGSDAEVVERWEGTLEDFVVFAIELAS